VAAVAGAGTASLCWLLLLVPARLVEHPPSSGHHQPRLLLLLMMRRHQAADSGDTTLLPVLAGAGSGRGCAEAAPAGDGTHCVWLQEQQQARCVVGSVLSHSS
jgi:hypothetical protein